MSATCRYCGAPVKATSQGGHTYSAWRSTTYVCGTRSDTDGEERSEECIRRQAEQTPAAVLVEAEEPKPIAAAQPVKDVALPEVEGPTATFQEKFDAWDAWERSRLDKVLAKSRGINSEGCADDDATRARNADEMRLVLKAERTRITGKGAITGKIRAGLEALISHVKGSDTARVALIQSEEDRHAKEVEGYQEKRTAARRKEAEEAGVQPDAKILADAADINWRKHLEALIESKRVAEERRERRDARLAEAREAGATLEDIGGIDALPDISEEEWSVRVQGWRDRTAAREEAARLERERLEAERIERERLEAEARETARQHEIAMAEERRKQDEERAELNRQAEENRRAAEEAKREADAAKAELQRLQDEKKAEDDRKAREAQEAQERADKEAADAAAAARREAQRPDREKIAAWCRVAAGSITAPPEIADASLRAALEGCHLDILNRISLLATETQENA